MVLNHRDYEKSIKNLINDKIKFKDLSDVTIEQESKLQRSLTTLKSYVWSMKNMKNMKKIIQVVLLLLKIYESPKMHKPFDSNSLLTFVLLFLPLVLTTTIFPNIFVNSFLLIY